MASPELAIVVEAMRSNNPIAGEDLEAIRRVVSAADAAFVRPDDVKYEPVQVGGVPAEWTIAEGANADRVLIYFHGGGYVICSIGTHRGLCTRLSRAAGARVLNVDYRLAPEHPYPAAVDDALAVYRAVLADGVDPARIAIGGDSAGGGLTLATLVALRDAGDPLPAAGVCISPWTDLSLSGESIRTKAAEDPLIQPSQLAWMAGLYLGDADPKAPTASPLFANLSGLPPLLVHVGTAEILLDDATLLAERAREAGVDVTLEAWEEMIHTWHNFADLLPEGREAIEGIGKYLRARLG